MAFIRLSRLARGIGMVAVITVMSGCGYQLRDYERQHLAHLDAPVHRTFVLSFGSGSHHDELARLLQQKLRALGMQQLQGIHASAQTQQKIHIDALNFRQFKLVGVLSEIRVVLSAKVYYQWQAADGSIQNHEDTLQVASSYQYNEADISTHDAQNTQVRHTLTDTLATRISEQYHSLSQTKPPL